MGSVALPMQGRTVRTSLQRTRMHAHHEVRAIGTGACNMQLSVQAQHSPQGHNFVNLWSRA